MNEDELLSRLRAADPALAHTAATPDVGRLVAAAMTSAGPAAPVGRQATSRRPRLLAVAAAVLLAAGGLITWQSGRSGTHAPTAAPLVLTVRQDGGGARCAAPTVEVLRTNTTAFEGAATSVTGDRVTFRVSHWYRGDDASTVVVKRAKQLEGVTFTTGEHYLVVARNGTVTPCGGTVGAESGTRQLYRQAFR
ncbi:hypothetical protein ABZV75_27105 [Streptomyces flaveolus]|uniref:hypothetical protein n=1 Tax=Streptomyces flaveolus TaxID=67297 RepID=UPI0033B85DC6